MSGFASDARDVAWFAVHDALPAYWLVGPITFDPGRRQFSVTARAPHPGRGKHAVTVSGAGLNTGIKGQPVQVTVTATKNWFMLGGLSNHTIGFMQIANFHLPTTLSATSVMLCE